MPTKSLPLSGIRVLDFSTLLPGPVCTLLLAEAGAEVIKIERPESGDDMRGYQPQATHDSANFVLLNRGKKSIALDLKQESERDRLRPLIASADVLVEQFRPGVMTRLGLDYASISAINPRLVYCSITGYGQHGPQALVAAHDLNYMADAGMLASVADHSGAPPLPPALIADIAGGAYPAFANILLALRQRDQTGKGCHLDISMSDSLFTFMYAALAQHNITGQSPGPAEGLVFGGTPRYQIYKTQDGRFLAAAPLEEKFWQTFCNLIDLPEPYRSNACPVQQAVTAIQDLIRQKTAAQWSDIFANQDVCVVVVKSFEEALNSAHFKSRGLFSRQVFDGKNNMTALPVPIAEGLRAPEPSLAYPKLGQHNTEYLGSKT